MNLNIFIYTINSVIISYNLYSNEYKHNSIAQERHINLKIKYEIKKLI